MDRNDVLRGLRGIVMLEGPCQFYGRAQEVILDPVESVRCKDTPTCQQLVNQRTENRV
jgi:hypothetical protein